MCKRIEAYTVLHQIGPYRIQGLVLVDNLCTCNSLKINIYMGLNNLDEPYKVIDFTVLAHQLKDEEQKERFINKLIEIYGTMFLPELLHRQAKEEALSKKNIEAIKTKDIKDYTLDAANKIVKHQFPKLELRGYLNYKL